MQEFIYHLAISLPGFLLAIVFHEFAHARVALWFGDDTAERQGRLTLNPIVHADPVGTLLFPLIGAAMGGVMFGWARPVPVDPRRFKNVKHGVFWVSFAGPGANIILSVLSALIFAIVFVYVPQDFKFYRILTEMLRSSILINLVLAVFNLIPFPPLDGSKMVTSFLDYNQARKYEELGRYSMVFILILWFTNIFSYLMLPAVLFGNGMMNLFISILA
ncbi:MAG: site-2 protease family protein [Bacteriovoracaceae bacterium]|nr:site-2 protease family protein [Bacteriovoracaceae bacterium]